MNVYSVFVKSYNKNMESMYITPIFTSLFTDLGLVLAVFVGRIGSVLLARMVYFLLVLQ